MCFAVYLASDVPPPLVRWIETEPRFNAVSITANKKLIKKQFLHPYIVYAGSHEGCGCGFVKDGETGDDLALVQTNYDALVLYLSEQMATGAKIEIFSCWEGEQGAAPETKEKITLDKLGTKEFEFQIKAYYEVA
ncbi:hypothetical protein HNE05_09235 [Aquipseudomonas campi]|uniref:Uncharacterized protein n=1 Tax=Aquipseudomonas campi TaxID=2731681 RepID=A0A6M8FBG9_9GAMM|nr:hypothetical protein [Pseudomonas campi]QKE63533.1 hypothetical protein HNE05_09235 [Pseudomonas campi]